MLRFINILLFALCLSSCATWFHRPTVGERSELLQGKREFENGYYLDAMHRLLPLACDGDPQAQYAVGYMFYYGYGVGQDTVIGCFWIKRAADQGYPPAIEALKTTALNTATNNPKPALTITPMTQAQELAGK